MLELMRTIVMPPTHVMPFTIIIKCSSDSLSQRRQRSSVKSVLFVHKQMNYNVALSPQLGIIPVRTLLIICRPPGKQTTSQTARNKNTHTKESCWPQLDVIINGRRQGATPKVRLKKYGWSIVAHKYAFANDSMEFIMMMMDRLHMSD